MFPSSVHDTDSRETSFPRNLTKLLNNQSRVGIKLLIMIIIKSQFPFVKLFKGGSIAIAHLVHLKQGKYTILTSSVLLLRIFQK